MPRYILIDNASGYVWADTSDIDGKAVPVETPEEACRVVDESLGVHGRQYAEATRLASNETGYHVYRADIDGSEVVPLIEDGQDPDTIQAVQDSCLKVALIRCFPGEE